jgi:hypothetical protein
MDMSESREIPDRAVLPAHVQRTARNHSSEPENDQSQSRDLRTAFLRAKGEGPLTPGDSLTYGDLDPFGKSCVQPMQQERRKKVFVSIHPPVIGCCTYRIWIRAGACPDAGSDINSIARHTEKHNVTTSCLITRVVFVLVFLFPCLALASAGNKKPAEAG